MGLIYTKDVKETEIMSAYGFTVYGEVHKYEWTIFDNKTENAVTSIRICDSENNELLKMVLGNNCIFQSRIDDTMDNFLYWIATENPDAYLIEKTVFDALCQSNSLFDNKIINKKLKAKRQEDEHKRIEERQELEKKQKEDLNAYCRKKGLFYYIGYDGEVIVFKAHTNDARSISAKGMKDRKMMETIIAWMKKYPKNNETSIMQTGTLEEVLKALAIC